MNSVVACLPAKSEKEVKNLAAVDLLLNIRNHDSGDLSEAETFDSYTKHFILSV